MPIYLRGRGTYPAAGLSVQKAVMTWRRNCHEKKKNYDGFDEAIARAAAVCASA